MTVKELNVIKKEIFEAMVSGDLDEAVSLLKNNDINTLELTEVAEKAYVEAMRNKNNLVGLAISEQFSLHIKLKLDAISAQFRALGEQKEFEQAFDWGIKYSVSHNEINSVSVKAFNEALKENDVSGALEYIRKFEIPNNLIVNDARRSFNALYEAKEFLKAFLLGKEFEMSPKRTLTAGLIGYRKLLDKGKIKEFVELEQSYSVLHDRDVSEVAEKEIKLFLDTFKNAIVDNYIDQNKPDKLYDVLESLKIFDDSSSDSLIPKLLALVKTEAEKLHDGLMKEERGPAAYDIVKNFKLLDDSTPEDIKIKVILSAENTHHKLMNDNNLNAALFLKESYELFMKNALENSQAKMEQTSTEYLKTALSKGEIDNIKTLIKKYEISERVINETSAKAIFDYAYDEQFGTIFEIMRCLKPVISDPDTLSQITTRFHQAFEDGQMELAANLDFYFKLKEFRARKATLLYWKSLADSGKYSEAAALKKERKIPKKLLQPLLVEKYDELISRSKKIEAIKLKQEYNLKFSIWAVIIRRLKRLFGGWFKLN